MTEFLDTNLGIFILILAQSFAVVAAILVSLAFLLYMDRKVWPSSAAPNSAESARRIAQSSRASPGGKPARSALCGRPSVLT